MERCRQNIRVSRGTQTPKEKNQTSLESKKQISPGQGSRTGLGSLGLRTLRSTKEESFSLAILRRCGGRERKHCRSRQPRGAKLRAKAKMEKAVSRKSRRIRGTFSESSAGAAASRGFVNPPGSPGCKAVWRLESMREAIAALRRGSATVRDCSGSLV